MGRIRGHARSAVAPRAQKNSPARAVVIKRRWACCPASVALLSKIPGATVVDLDAGCCGMAGSFGYTKDHYDVSVAIANRKLLPAVKAMQPGDALVAVGTSCRHQVESLAHAQAVHQRFCCGACSLEPVSSSPARELNLLE